MGDISNFSQTLAQSFIKYSYLEINVCYFAFVEEAYYLALTCVH